MEVSPADIIKVGGTSISELDLKVTVGTVREDEKMHDKVDIVVQDGVGDVGLKYVGGWWNDLKQIKEEAENGDTSFTIIDPSKLAPSKIEEWLDEIPKEEAYNNACNEWVEIYKQKMIDSGVWTEEEATRFNVDSE